MAQVLARIRHLHSRLLKVKVGPGAIILPERVTRVDFSFDTKFFPNHAMRFWRSELQTLKLHNPEVTMIAYYTHDGREPRLRVFWRPDSGTKASKVHAVDVSPIAKESFATDTNVLVSAARTIESIEYEPRTKSPAPSVAPTRLSSRDQAGESSPDLSQCPNPMLIPLGEQTQNEILTTILAKMRILGDFRRPAISAAEETAYQELNATARANPYVDSTMRDTQFQTGRQKRAEKSAKLSEALSRAQPSLMRSRSEALVEAVDPSDLSSLFHIGEGKLEGTRPVRSRPRGAKSAVPPTSQERSMSDTDSTPQNLYRSQVRIGNPNMPLNLNRSITRTVVPRR